ncbi:hypothetical protein [Paenibacillus elgii]|uniref:hypothetical protein n=1 Tax=Paenibacillus elgii TaxID=189691 RepID=UPI001CB94EC6|nr:hypothetical protein [Paenibacillus elgii]
MLRRIMEPSFTIQFDLTLKNALMDFYQMKKHQLIVPSKLETVNDAYVEKQISQILYQIS